MRHRHRAFMVNGNHFRASIIRSCLALTFTAPVRLSWAQAPSPTFAKDIAELKSVQIKRVELIAQKKVGDYGGNSSALADDLLVFRREAQKLEIFPDTPEFEQYWEANLKKFTSPSALGLMKDVPVNQFALAIYAAAETDNAAAIDARSPDAAQLKKSGLPTPGDRHFVKTTEDSEARRNLVLIGVSAGATLAVVGAKIKDIFFFGTGSQLTNTAAEPFIRPIRERLDQIVNTHLAPRLVPWARFVTGESERQRKALKAAAQGEKLTGNLERYAHPSVSIEGFVQDHKDFYGEMMAADAKWKGWLSAEFQRARNTGWELIYAQPRWLNEQLNTFSTAINTSKLVQTQVLVPALLREGAKPSEIDALADLVRKQQDIMVFEDVRSPKVAALDKAIMKIVENWTGKKKMNPETIRAFYDGQLQLVMAENRPAFALAAFLDSERYYQEYNLALKDLPKLQMWQEQSREMTGIYNELRKHREKIEKFFLRRGIKYDVMARVNERGFPLGGDPRPQDLNPVTDVTLDHLDGIEANCDESMRRILRP